MRARVRDTCSTASSTMHSIRPRLLCAARTLLWTRAKPSKLRDHLAVEGQGNAVAGRRTKGAGIREVERDVGEGQVVEQLLRVGRGPEPDR